MFPKTSLPRFYYADMHGYYAGFDGFFLPHFYHRLYNSLIINKLNSLHRKVKTANAWLWRLVHSKLFHRNGFRQVAGLVHVTAFGDGDVVGKQLERDDGQDGLEALLRVRDLEIPVG